MISKDLFWRMKWEKEFHGLTTSQLARRFNLSKATVRYWLKQDDFTGRKPREIDSVIGPYKDIVAQMLKECADYSARQVYQRLLEEGYEGSYVTVCRCVGLLRPPKFKAYFKLHFEPGEAVQVDFGACGYISFAHTRRRLSVLVMTLCHSRLMYVEFVLCERQEHFLTCLQNGFTFFGGVPERVIVDNFKCAVVKHNRYEAPVFNARFLDFAGHYGFRPTACNPHSPNEKGRVENGVGYVKHNFMTNRQFGSLAEARTALQYWLNNTANVRCHGTTNRKPVELFREKERSALQPLNSNRFDCATPETRNADRRCRVWFDGNSYSVPSRCSGQKVLVKADPDNIHIYLNTELAALHRRCYDRKQETVDPDHFADIRKERQRAKEQNLIKDFLRLGHAAPAFLEGLESKQLNPRQHLRKVLILAESMGSETVAEAIETAVEFQSFRSEYIENIVMQKRRKCKTPNGRLHVPKAADLLELHLEQPDLDCYKI